MMPRTVKLPPLLPTVVDFNATADGVGRVRMWELGTRHLLRTIEATQPVCGVAWSPDGTLVGAGQCGPDRHFNQ